MPADFSPYVDLIPYDVSPTDVYLGAVQLGRVVLPELEFRQGTPDDAMLQAFSYVSALTVGAVNRLPPRLMEGICAMMGLPRNQGSRATVSAVITLNDYETFVLPQGTAFVHVKLTDTGATSTAYETIAAVTVPQSDALDEFGDPNPLPTVTVDLSALFVGISPLVLAGDQLQCEVVLPQLDTAVALTGFANGTNPEDPEYYLTRARTYLQSLSANTATAKQIEAFVLTSFDNVSRCKIYDLTNADVSLDQDAVDVPGYSAVFIWGLESALPYLDTYNVLVAISDKSTAGLNFTVSNFSTVDVGATISVVYDSDFNPDDVENNIKAVLAGFLSPFGFTSKAESFQINELKALVSQVAGVLYVLSFTLTDPSNETGAGDPKISFDVSTGDLVFNKKGILPVSSESNFTITLTPR